MKELSLHILDIAQNSIVAGANLIEIEINEDSICDRLTFIIKDNGKGMSPEMLRKVIDPYTTSRTTRRVGLGLPLLHDACKSTGGDLVIESVEGKGTVVKAVLGLSHIDRQPLGDISGVIVLLASANPKIIFNFHYIKNGGEYIFNTKEVEDALDGIPLNTPEVGRLLRQMIESNLEEL